MFAKNDLPEISHKIKEYDDSIFKVSKSELLQSKDYSFSANKYKEVDFISSTFEIRTPALPEIDLPGSTIR